jgi:mannan endo-1,4-beta-mannosidase
MIVMNKYKTLLTVGFMSIISFYNCKNTPENSHMDEATGILYQNLKNIANDGKLMFGVANPSTIMYKETHIYSGFETSDIKEITGQNPAVYESDFMWYDDPKHILPDKTAMKKAFERGAVLAYCWHLRGKNSNSFYSKDKGRFTSDKSLVKEIVAGGSREDNPSLDWLYTKLDTLVIPTFKEFGFPIIFRPWHEMNGGWFWWGSDNCTPDEYVKLYRITVDYMRKSGLKNILYAWSPDTKFTMEYYPGDEYVDILGLDIYEMGAVDYKPLEMVVKELEKMIDYADSAGKITAITETGLRKENGVFRYPEVNPNYWTKNVLEPLVSNPKLSRVVWVLSWYSSDWSGQRQSQVYYPYKGMENDFEKGQAAIDDFFEFYNHPATLFENDLPKMYTIPEK